jgi:hypothetical protein
MIALLILALAGACGDQCADVSLLQLKDESAKSQNKFGERVTKILNAKKGAAEGKTRSASLDSSLFRKCGGSKPDTTVGCSDTFINVTDDSSICHVGGIPLLWRTDLAKLTAVKCGSCCSDFVANIEDVCGTGSLGSMECLPNTGEDPLGTIFALPAPEVEEREFDFDSHELLCKHFEKSD